MGRDRTAFTAAERQRLTRMRVARLATADAAGQPHVIPIVFALDEHKLYTPLDGKPKRVGVHQLKRVRNLLANPQVAIVIDEYDEDWTRLWWVMVTGRGEIVENGEAHRAGVGLLQRKYPQYNAMPLTDRPIVVVTPLGIASWGAVSS